MKKILHRCNTLESAVAACTEYDGAEVDVRYVDGQLILRHDRNDPSTWTRLRYLVQQLDTLRGQFTLFINVKEHELAPHLFNVLREPPVNFDYVIFDVPGVELAQYAQLGLQVFGRNSEYESQWPELPSNGSTINGWLVDAFDKEDQGPLVRNALATRKVPVALISEGCHGRLGRPNYLVDVDYLIGKATELAVV